MNLSKRRRGYQKGQSRETDNTGYTTRRKTIQKDTICIEYHYAEANTNDVNIFISFSCKHSNNYYDKKVVAVLYNL